MSVDRGAPQSASRLAHNPSSRTRKAAAVELSPRRQRAVIILYSMVINLDTQLLHLNVKITLLVQESLIVTIVYF